MKITILFILLILVSTTAESTDKLLQQADFTYLGSFRVPAGDMGGPQFHGLHYGGAVIGYNPTNNSLFITGHSEDQLVAEISIPSNPVNSTNLNLMPTAEVIQNLYDITEGHRLETCPGRVSCGDGTRIGGLLVLPNGTIMGSMYDYYNGGGDAQYTHFTHSTVLSQTGTFRGMFQTGYIPSEAPYGDFTAGFMTPIPENWQSVIGKKYLTGMGGLSVLFRNSAGPAAFAFNPEEMSMENPSHVIPLIYYPIDHMTIGAYSDIAGTYYHSGTDIVGAIWPSGTKTYMVTGTQGTGDPCYGASSGDINEKGNTPGQEYPHNQCGGQTMAPDEANHPCCYDPALISIGGWAGHSYPYEPYVWAYDADDLLRVKNGGRVCDDPSPNLVDSISPTSTDTYHPWSIKPYAGWTLNGAISWMSKSVYSTSVAYDSATHTLYATQAQVDDNLPIINVFHVNIDGALSKKLLRGSGGVIFNTSNDSGAGH